MKKLLSIGKIINFHGVEGETRVGYTQGKEKQISELKDVYVQKESNRIPLTVQRIRFHKNYAIMKFKEITTVNEVLELKGCFIKAEKPVDYLDEDEFFIDDLVGLDAFDTNGSKIGEVSYVVNLKGEDLIAIKTSDSNESLIPFVKDLVPEISLKERKVVINVIPGLLKKAASDEDEI